MYRVLISIENQKENIVNYFENFESAQEFYHKARKGFGELNVVLREVK